MLEFVGIKNFKAFKSAQFALKNLSIISGVNGVGKSSFIQSLLLLRQSYEKNVINTGLLLNGDYVNIGFGRNAIYHWHDNDEIAFILRWSDVQEKSVFSYKLLDNSNFLQVSEHHKIAAQDILSKQSLFNIKLKFLSAERESPKDGYDPSDYHVLHNESIGTKGEYTAHYMHSMQKQELPIHALRHPKATSYDFIENVRAWMSEFTPFLKIDMGYNEIINKVFLHYCLPYLGVKNVHGRAQFNPINVGFGLSMVIPVINSVLSAKPGDLLIVENPEAHLHPAAQTLIGKLYAIAAANGVQVIIETHSDHLFNGVRIAVKQNKISCNDVSIFFITAKLIKNEFASEVTTSEISQEGRIALWPDGFFDQWDKDLDELL